MRISPRKPPKNWIWAGLGLHLGRVWGALERLGATFGRILTACWTFQIISFWNNGPRWAPRGLLDGFWIDFGRVWGGFGCVLGEFGLSKLKLLRHMVISWTLWVSPAASHFATGTPALPRFASRSVTIWKFLPKDFRKKQKVLSTESLLMRD